MAEEKAKKNTSTKSNRNTQNKTNRNGKTNSRKRTTNQNRRTKTTNQTKKTQTKKVTPKTTTKKEEVKVLTEVKEIKQTTEPKEQTPKEITPVEEPKVETLSKEEQLEKTIIFDGTHNKNLNDVVDKLEEDNVVLEDKVIKRSKTKKAIIILLIIAIVGLIVGTTYYVVSNETNNSKLHQNVNINLYKKVSKVIKKEGKLSAKEEPAELAENYENIETISLADLEQKIVNKEDMVVLIASTNCYHCAAYEPIVDEVFGKNNKTIYRINVISLTKAEGQRLLSYYYFTDTPTIFSVKDGYVSSELKRTTTKEDLDKWVKSL